MPGGYHVKWGVDGAGVEGVPVPLAVGAARARASVFLAALHASGYHKRGS
jgi:hypothetical protein